MPDKYRVMPSADNRPLYVKFDAEGPETFASQRTRRVAQWAHSLGFVRTDCALSNFDPCLRVCPQRLSCEAAALCLQAWTRQARIMHARFSVAEACAPQARRA